MEWYEIVIAILLLIIAWMLMEMGLGERRYRRQQRDMAVLNERTTVYEEDPSLTDGIVRVIEWEDLHMEANDEL